MRGLVPHLRVAKYVCAMVRGWAMRQNAQHDSTSHARRDSIPYRQNYTGLNIRLL